MEEVSSNAVEIRFQLPCGMGNAADPVQRAGNVAEVRQKFTVLDAKSNQSFRQIRLRASRNKGGRADNPCITGQRPDVGDRKGSGIAEEVIRGVWHTLGNVLPSKFTTLAILNEVVSVKK